MSKAVIITVDNGDKFINSQTRCFSKGFPAYKLATAARSSDPIKIANSTKLTLLSYN